MTANEDCNVYFQDEGIFGRMSNPVGCWSPKRVRPDIPTQRIRQYDYVYAAVCPKTGDMFSLIMPHANATCMDMFLKEFEKYREGKKSIVIMDNAGWHTTDKISKSGNVRIAFQPPYSPELNPVEHLWKHIQTNYIHNRFWDSLKKMEDYLCEYLAELSLRNETIKNFSLFD